MAHDTPILLGLRILVVEDEALIAMLFEDWLLDAGAEVVGPAATVPAAMALIEAARTAGGIDVAILDVNLGGTAATPFAARLRELGIPLLIATGSDDALPFGLHASAPVLRKPFELQEMLDGLEAAMAPAGPGYVLPRPWNGQALRP